jgi:hypothetical protein
MTKRVFQEEEVFNLELKAHNAGARVGRNSERRRIVEILNKYANADCPETLCDSVCECFAKHEARMFIELIGVEE